MKDASGSLQKKSVQRGERASLVAAKLEQPDATVLRALEAVYGQSPVVQAPRISLLRLVVGAYLSRFGDDPIRLFRVPGRINLRGMHVDTHGGYLNLMTHQREVVLAVCGTLDGRIILANIDSRYPDVEFQLHEVVRPFSPFSEWLRFVMGPEVQARVQASRGDWGNYVLGCALRLLHCFPTAPRWGLRGVIGSDLPVGAALSSSAALCLAVLLGMLTCSGTVLDNPSLILAARDAEWYAGSRCGLSDQAAMVLGGLGQLICLAIHPNESASGGHRRSVAFPAGLRVLVANSYTQRSLSGTSLVNYTRNRFGYTMGLQVLRGEMESQQFPGDLLEATDSLASLSPQRFESLGGVQALYRLLRCIPERLSLSELKNRCHLPELDAILERYFGSLPKESWPDEVALRGPLLFGIAESERARLFFEALQGGDFHTAGRLMTVGHDGDRRFRRNGSPFCYDVSDAALEQLERQQTPIHWCPGAYRASSAVLDALVDAALDAGALGASLTGAGIGGAVLALCREETADEVAQALRRPLASPDYPALSGRQDPLTLKEIEEAVVDNYATAQAGEVLLAATPAAHR